MQSYAAKMSTGMDPPCKNLFESFKDEIWEDLGELDPNWFETLTAQATSEGNVSDHDDLCLNQEGNFKTPFDRTGANSQLFSTPKVFRSSRAVSPDTENEQSFTAEHDKETVPWISMSKEGLPDVKCENISLQSHNCFDLLNTPQKTPVSYAQHISESLGAEVNQDISWTSSLNTPSTVLSTLILTKPDKSPSPVSLSARKNVFVRELFPSLSNPSRLGALSGKNNVINQGAVSPEPEQNPAPPESPDASLAQSDGVWKQTLPDAIRDAELRTTVAGVLEGAEDVLSIFFTNSNTALRKVKSDRIKRKQILPTKEHDCSSVDSTTQEPARLSSLPPARTGDIGVTQWSPLSLSEIPPSSEGASSPRNSPATQMQNNTSTTQLFDHSQQVTPTVKVSRSGFTKRKRKFVYTIETTKQHVQGEDSQSQATEIQNSGLEESMKQSQQARDEAGNVQVETQKKENLPLSVQEKVQHFDISQLSRDFAQDFSQMPEHSYVSKVAEDTPQTGFSPSACLSAVKQANQRARQANPQQDWDGDGKGRSVASANRSHSICELTASDSGFLSAFADSTNLTASTSIQPNGLSQQGTDLHRTTPVPSASNGNGKARLDEDLKEDKPGAEMSKEHKGSQIHGSGTEGARGTVDNTNWTSRNGQTHGEGPEKTTVSLPSSHASGFKTASNKGIKITSANLEKAKRLFEETEEQNSFSVQPVKHLKAQGSMKSPTCNSNPSSTDKLGNNTCLLTASQKADVTELCSLLEEADSQFEFTQVRTAKLKQQCQGSSSSPQTADKELDPDFLTGIDFDESISSDAEQHLAATAPSDVPSNSTDLSLSGALRKEGFSAEDVSHSKRTCKDDGGSLSAESRNLDRAEHMETSTNPLMLGVGFETAGGNVLRVSKKCLLKARALFADLQESQKTTDTQISKTATQTPQRQRMENHILHQKKGNALCSNKQVIDISDSNMTQSLKNVKVDTTECHSGFQKASGKGISISAKALKEANAFFKDCEVVGTNPDSALKYKKSLQPSSGSVSHQKNLTKLKHVNFSEEPVDELEDVNAEPGFAEFSNPTVKEMPTAMNTSLCGNLPLSAKAPLSHSRVTSVSMGSSATNAWGSEGGFCMASGQKVTVSADAMDKAKSLLDDTHMVSKEAVGPVSLPRSSGFQTATGKGVVISAAALKKAKSLLSECVEVKDENSAKPAQFKTPVPLPPSRSRGFVAASGKPVALSAEALQKAKALFSDIGDFPESPNVSHTRSNNRREDSNENAEKMNSGFSTAGGDKVHVSEKNLSKAKNTLRELDSGPGADKAMQEADAFSEDDGIVEMCENMLSTDDAEIQNQPFRQKCSSLSTTSKSTGSSISELSSHGGFSTASGRKVLVSDDALSKAKSLLAENDPSEDTNKQPTFPQSRGFQTASGRGVVISSAALNKAKALLSECVEVEAKIDVKSIHSKTPHPPPRNHGFVAASSKSVAVSAEAVQKATALFSDISVSAEVPATSHQRSNRKGGVGENIEKKTCGFSTARGDKVHVSQKNLLKAKNVLREFDDGPSMDSFSKEEGESMTAEQVVSCEKVLPSDDSEIHNPSLRAKSTSSKSTGSSSISELSSHGGFSTASGRKVLVSDDALSKAKSLLAGNDPSEDTNKQPTLPQSRGFQTASGRGVVISSAALNKAKALLSECAEVKDVEPTYSKSPAPVPPRMNHGFLAASGKPVSLSAEALQKAKALFSDISISAEVPPVTRTRSSGRSPAGDDAVKIDCGFSTAGGAKVYVAQKNLAKAKNLLEGFADRECPDSVSAHVSQKLDVSKAKDDEGGDVQGTTPRASESSISFKATVRENRTLQTSSVSIKDKASADVLKDREGNLTPFELGSLHDSPTEKMSSVLDCEMNPISSGEASEAKGMDESSLFQLQTLNLSGCTETQQLLLAQEALDCTKALLEDESLAGQRLSADSENVPARDISKSSYRSEMEQRKGSGKRRMDDADLSGQPPLKRRLLEEFDRSVSGPRASVRCPGPSSPNGVFRDRHVFKYSASLQPNITGPHSNGRNYTDATLQHSTPRVGESTHSKMPTFTPPFLKQPKPESSKKTILKDNTRTPPAFVPPFKKQRTIVQESSSKPQDGKDEHRRAFVPPTRKTRSTTDVTDHNRAGDVQETSANTPNENQQLPVACGSEGSASEASHMEEMGCSRQEVFQNLENIELARDMQHMRLRKKKRQTIRPLPGSLFLIRTSGASRIRLRAAVGGKCPARYSKKQLYSLGVHEHVSEVTSETAEAFRFRLQHFVRQETLVDRGGVQLADGGWLVPSNDGTAGKEEFYRALCDTPGVDPKLISEEWAYNHYRWIVWKQASMERSLPETMGALCLTPEQVLLQLKYRYDVEVDHSRRPALRKIMEKDDTAAKTLVLCVCGIVSRGVSAGKPASTRTPGAEAKVEVPTAVVWLTDGWYAIKAQLDEALTAMLQSGRLAVGAKIITHGVQLLGSQDACSPLEAPESLMFKICANSCRLARWDAKLGFHRDPRPFLLPLSSLLGNGGPVGCVDVIILRSYPIQWMERKPDGGVVFRSARAEEKEARRHSGNRQKAMEVLFTKIQAEFENEEKGKNKPQRRRRTITRQNVARLQDGEELYEAVQDDPAYLEAQLSDQQRETLRSYRQSLMEKKQAELQDRYRRALEKAEGGEGGCPRRDVTPVWRLCIADSIDEPGNVYQLSLWRPPSDLQSLLKEGCRYRVYNLTASDGRKHGGCTTLQLSGTKKTQFQDLQASQEWLSTRFQPRVCTDFMELQSTEFQPLCREVDLSGYVVSVVDGQGLSPAFYLADGSLNFLKVRFFSSLAQSGLEDMVKPRALLALSNLQLRGQSTSPTPVVYAGDLTNFSTNPKEVHLQESLRQLRNLVQGQENFFLAAEEKLSHLLKSGSLSSASSPALQIQTPVSAQDRRTSQPNRSLGSFTPVGRSSLSRSLSTENDPKSLKRRRALDYLCRVPSPPPLSPLISAASPAISKTFNPPRRTPSTLKTVETPPRKPVSAVAEEDWVNDEELAMIDTQALLVGDSV